MREELRDLKMAVIMGGVSAEREVSLKSGNAIYNTLKDAGYNVVSLDADTATAGKLLSLNADLAVLALHGGWGEDGSIQGMLEVMGLPYTGCGVSACAVAMDKVLSKFVFESCKIKTPRYVIVEKKNDSLPLTDEINADFNMPWVVKPHKEGSSIGVSIVKTRQELSKALKSAFSFGSKVIVEEYIKGREIHTGIISGKVLGSVEVRPKNGFYDFNAKYTSGLTEYILPPQILDDVHDKLKNQALKAYKSIGCAGACRIDQILADDGSCYVLEINTLPGMTQTSLMPKIAKEAGLSFLDLIEESIMEALNLKKTSLTEIPIWRN
ncbi:D-alanine--D-alanine ligase [Candidatus Magnetoovum chiemensis]|nr:D-alanine--D-alanine ligase [Candidatus Magnetoovum chiemensis]